jgi:hypothetical protein
MISNILTAACEEQNLFYAPYIPLQTTYIPILDHSPSLKQFLGMKLSDKICITNEGVYIVLDMINAGSWVKVSWLTDSGEIIKRKYEI